MKGALPIRPHPSRPTAQSPTRTSAATSTDAQAASMLAQLSRQRRALQQLGPLAVAGCAALQQSGSLQQSRGMSMRIFEVG